MPQPQSRQRGNSNMAAFRPSARWQLETYCGICGAHFSYVRTRHHCRHCGMSVCGRHSRQRVVVPTSLSTLAQRVCDTCFPICQNAPRRPRGFTVGAQRSTGGSTSSGGSRRGNKAGRDATGSTYTDGSASGSSDSVTSPRIRSPRTLDHPRRGGVTPSASQKRAASSGDSIRSTKPIVSPLPVRSDAKKTLSIRKTSKENPSVCNTDTTASSVSTLSEVSISDKVLPAQRNRPLPFRRKPSSKSRHSRMSRDVSFSSFAIFSFASDSESDSDSDSGSDLDDSDNEDSDELDSDRSAAQSAATAAKEKADKAKADKEKADKERADADAAARRMARARAVNPPSVDTSNQKIVPIRKRIARPPTRKSRLREKESLNFGASSSSIDFGLSKITGKYLESNPTASEVEWDPGASTTSVITRKYLQQPSSTEQKRRVKSVISSSSSDDARREEKERPVLGKSAVKNSSGARSRLSSLSDLDDQDARKDRSSSVDSEECFSDEEAEALAQFITASRRKGRGQTLPDAVPEEEPPSPATTATYAIREQDRADMAGVAALEQRILDAQRELPALFDELQTAKERAARATKELRESRARVQRYQKAQAAVTRAMRAARAAMDQREFLAAILELTRAAAVERTNATVWFLLAQCRLSVRQLADAEEACMTSVSLQPTAAGVALLGRILQAQGRHDEAVECYLSALGRDD